ncbi:MAG: helicase-associated domain-containing protein, partial [Spirochaetia bacterium]
MAEQKYTPLIVQSDSTLLLDVHDPGFAEARDEIGTFAELEKSPEHFHTYRITPLSLWNAASAGIAADRIFESLNKYSRYPVPENILYTIKDILSRFGKLRLIPTEQDDRFFLAVSDQDVFAEIQEYKKTKPYLIPDKEGFYVNLVDRGYIKQELIRIGYPVKDEVPLKKGESLDISLKEKTSDGYTFTVRDYQEESASTFLGDNKPGNGFGTIVLPCGAGKTIVGMKVMDLLNTNTLILTTNVASVHQWRDELLDKTNLTKDVIGEYTGARKVLKPVTIG